MELKITVLGGRKANFLPYLMVRFGKSAFSCFKNGFGIIVAAILYALHWFFGGEDFGGDGVIKGGGNDSFELFLEVAVDEADGTADDDGGGLLFADDLGDAEGEAGGYVKESAGGGDFFDVIYVVGGVDGFDGGEIFPRGNLAVIGEGHVAGLKGSGSRGELVVFHDAAADAGAEGEVDGTTFFVATFVEGSEIGVIFKVKWASDTVGGEHIFYTLY